MEGEDIKDSNCIDFNKIAKIRVKERLYANTGGQNCLKGIKVGVVEEFEI